MQITTKWNVEKILVRPEIDGHENVVSTVYWRLGAIDEYGNSLLEIVNSSKLDIPTPRSPIVQYEALTETQLLDWVHTTLGSTEVANLERNIKSNALEHQVPSIPVVPSWMVEE